LSRSRKHSERHVTARINWLRAAVLGANDGIVSTASLVLGVAAAHASHTSILVAGTAGLVAGAMSMAAGEYVSVHSQADIENAELAKEQLELHTDSEGEHKELAAIYVGRGLDPALAAQVAVQLISALLFLVLLGALAARVGGARVLAGALRIGFWGALAMAMTAGIGALIGHAT
jgi:VIT1/CCC1 family predicted Fe2+/Mn2+ transporter